MRRFILQFLWVLLAVPAFSQGAVISGQVNYNGLPVPFAPIRVCSVTSTNTPCTPTVPIYSDYQLQHIITQNPTAADQYGNFTIYVPALTAPNLYLVQITPTTGITWNYVYTGPYLGSSGGTINGNLSIVGNLAVTQTVTGAYFNATTAPYYQINGTQISSSALSDGSNLAKLNAANTFTSGPQTAPIFNATTQFNVNGSQIAAGNLANGTTGSGPVVLATSPNLVTPNIGSANGTSISLSGFADTEGFRVNGSAGSAGQCLGSDGSSYDTPISCLTSLGTLYYQTVQSNTTPLTQEANLNFASRFAASSSGSATTVDLATQGGVTPGSYTSANVTVNAYGIITAVANGSGSTPTSSANTSGYLIIPASPHNIIYVWGTSSPPSANSPYSQTLPYTFPNACLQAFATDNGARVSGVGGSSGNPSPSGAACESTSEIYVTSQATNTGGSGAEPVGYLAIGW